MTTPIGAGTGVREKLDFYIKEYSQFIEDSRHQGGLTDYRVENHSATGHSFGVVFRIVTLLLRAAAAGIIVSRAV